jgi:hypothetical protein
MVYVSRKFRYPSPTCYARMGESRNFFVETGLKARFLGQSYAVRALADMPAQPQVNLVYRGVSYKAR